MKQSVRKKGYSYIFFILGRATSALNIWLKLLNFIDTLKRKIPKFHFFKTQEARKLNLLSNKRYIYINNT